MTLKSDKEMVQAKVDRASAIELELVWIPKIMSKQTHEEVRIGSTIEYNKIGLSGYDGRYISELQSRLNQGEHLSEKQAMAVRRILRKYWKQYILMMLSTVRTGKY